MAAATTTRNWSNQFRPTFQEIEVNAIEEGATALMYACQQENVDQLQSILKKKPEAIRERDRTLKTVLHYCAENATLGCAEIILNAAPDIVDVADEDGYTTLHLAVIAGNIPLVNFLISKSADINALDAEQHSVIHWATVCGEVELLEILLKCKANPSTPDVHGGYPIHYAAQMCGAISEMSNDSKLGMAVLQVLLHHNVDVNVVDHDGRQPVLWAASAGSSDAVIALINAGASVRAHDKDGLTALHCAASRGHTDCLETLIELCAADVDVIDSNGCTPLFYSVTLGHADATQLLLRCQANPNRQDRKGRTPAHCGAAKGQFETLKILKKYNGNLWIRNAKGDYCLHDAVNSGRKDLVKWLLSQRPDAVNTSNNDGRCALHIAAITNNIEMCKILLDYQSLVNPVMRTSKGDLMTPLDAALHKGNRGCAKYLQLHGGVPANKLTSYSAALRGPHRVEIYSDYQGSPEGKLEAPYCARNSRSLDTSPSGYKSKGRKVQVRIRANVSSENIPEAFTSISEHHHRYRRKYEHEIHCGRTRFFRNRKQPSEHEFSSLSSSNVSNTDVDEGSSENSHKIYRRRRRRWEYNNCRSKEYKNHTRSKKHPKSRSESKYWCSDEEHDELGYRRSKVRVKFQKDSTENQKFDEQVKAETKNVDKGNHHTVTALVHREDENDTKDNQKPSESSENGCQEIQYQKLDTEVTDTDTLDNGKKDFGKIMNVSVQDMNPLSKLNTVEETEIFSDAFVNDPFTSSDKERRPENDNQTKTPMLEWSTEHQTNECAVSETIFSETKTPESVLPVQQDVFESTQTNKTNEANIVTLDSADNEMSNDQINVMKDKEIEGREISGEHENKNNDIETETIKPESSALNPNEDKLPVDDIPFVNATYELNEKEMETIKPESNVTNEKEQQQNSEDIQFLPSSKPRTDTSSYRTDNTDLKESEDLKMNSSKLNKFSNRQRSTSELEKFNEKMLEEYIIKDKGLICVILDDDETIEIKRRKDPVRSKSDSSRIQSASRKKERIMQKRQRRSKSSFEILSDNGNNEMRTTQDDSGFEPSPRHDVSNKTKSRIPRATNSYHSEKPEDSDPNINVSSVTQAVQNSLRKYHLERKIFHTLLELKRLQIRAGKSNEQVLVKRLVDDYQKAGLIVGLRTYDGIYSFRHFERYLYEQLRILQSVGRKDIPRIKSSDDFEKLTKALRRTKAGKTLLENVPDNPLFCTHGTHRCIHATHAYTGIPCAAYIAKLDHHKLPKENENYRCFLPRIDSRNPYRKNQQDIAKSLKHVDPSKPVTLELIHGSEKQIISLPTEKLDKNKRYYVTFTIKDARNQEEHSSDKENHFGNQSDIKMD